MKDFDQILEEYTIYIKVKGYKTGGGKFYPKAVKEFFDYLETQEIYSVKHIKNEHILSYYNCLIQRPNRRGGTLSISSINHHLFALRILIEWLLINKRITRDIKVPNNIKRERLEQAVLTREEIEILYSYCTSKLEACILSLAYGCGLRRSEIEALDITDLQLSKGSLIVREGKYNKRREIPLTDGLIAHFKEYIYKERPLITSSSKERSKAFLLSQYGTRLRGNDLNKKLKSLIESTGNMELQNKQISLHNLRHSIATHLAENGAGIEFIREFLGHNLIDTSQIYAIKNKQRNKYK